MGRNSQQRRQQRLRREQQQRRASTGPQAQRGQPPPLGELLDLACDVAHGPQADKALFPKVMELVHRLEAETDPLDRPSTELTRRLRAAVDLALEHGWQPADVVHAVKRQYTQRVARLATAFVADHARRHDAPRRAPLPWLDQLADLGAYRAADRQLVGGQGELIAAWGKAERLHPDDVLDGAVQLLALLRWSTRQPHLLPPPSKWPASNAGTQRTAAPPPGEIDAKALSLIRALLAKAEATTFEAEAGAFTAKAQQLMTRHSIDAAVLAAAAEGQSVRRGVDTRRVHIDDPYADEKVTFLAAVGAVNGVRCVWSNQPGFATLVGFPVDLQVTDLLFTSLLVQATHASAEATRHDARLRTASFRRAFLVAFAHRVAERLEEAKRYVTHEAEQEYGSALLPILASRDVAVDTTYAELFPGAVPKRGRQQVDAAGWYAGRAAAERADIGAGAPLPPG